MGVRMKKYGVSVSFCRKLTIFGKTVGKDIRILSKNLNFIKTHKNSIRGPVCITDPKYGGQDQEIRSFSYFFAANWQFSVKP
jgi:hypothetical protein